MLLVLCLVVTVVGTLADPNVVVTQYKNNNDGLGNYAFLFEQSDGTYRWQEGHAKKSSSGNTFIYTTGGYTYFDDKKKIHFVSFVADENGYRVIPSLGSVFAFPTRLVQGAGG